MFSDENILCQNKWSLSFNITFIFVFLYKKKKTFQCDIWKYTYTQIYKYTLTNFFVL